MILTTNPVDPGLPPQLSRIQWGLTEIIAVIAILLPLIGGAIGMWLRMAQVEQTIRQMVEQLHEDRSTMSAQIRDAKSDAAVVRDQVGRIREDIAGLQGRLLGSIDRR